MKVSRADEKKYMLAKDKTRRKVCGQAVEYTRHSLKSLVKHFPLFQALTDILTFSFFIFIKV